MDIQSRKIEFVQEFLNIQNEELISQFEKLLKKGKKAKSDKLVSPMSIAELNSRITKSERDFTNKRYKESSELIDKYK